jgi:REP element-mobilizing transposase RayT
MPYREFYRRYLPHWQPPGAALFVTFRLVGSIPQSVIEELRLEREIELRKQAQITDQIQQERQRDRDNRRSFGRWDEALDRSADSPRWLCQPEIAEIVAEALHYRDGKGYDLLAYCIMPNHVHIVFVVGRIFNPSYKGSQNAIPANDEPIPLQSMMQSLKRHTARKANLILGRQGRFWQEEYYDHAARDSNELDRIIQYVLNNPVKAGLVEKWDDWRWSYCKPGLYSNDKPD